LWSGYLEAAGVSAVLLAVIIVTGILFHVL